MSDAPPDSSASAATLLAIGDPAKSGMPCDMFTMPGRDARALSLSQRGAAAPAALASTCARPERRPARASIGAVGVGAPCWRRSIGTVIREQIGMELKAISERRAGEVTAPTTHAYHVQRGARGRLRRGGHRLGGAGVRPAAPDAPPFTYIRDLYRENAPRLPRASGMLYCCLLYTSPSPRDQRGSRMPSSA